MKIKTYKAFNKGLICQGFQYREGEEHHHGGKVALCESGFHSCENPLDVLNYYDLTESEFAETEAWGDIKGGGDDSKLASSDIKIKTKIDLPLFIKASFEFLWKKCYKNNLIKKYNSQLASSGYNSKLASSGYNSKLASSGYNSQLASSGYNSKLASSGEYSKLASSGEYSQLAMNGKDSVGANIGINGNDKGEERQLDHFGRI